MTRSRSIFLLAALSLAPIACVPRVSTRPEKKSTLEIKNKPIERAGIEHKDLVLIGIRVEVESVVLASACQVRARNLTTEEDMTWPAGGFSVSIDKGRFIINGEKSANDWRLMPTDPECHLQVGNNKYRGAIFLRRRSDDKFSVINELGIDDYLRGVLPREVVVTWAQQSLRVQAVASRTYLASHLGSHSKQGFDLCSDVHCQVYGGMTKEHPETNQAIDATRDQILTFKGKPIGAFFHSNCGGTTEEIKPVWGADNKPYLPRKKCTYGTADPRYNWKVTITNDDLLAALRAKTTVKGNKLKSLKIMKKSPSGRAETVGVTTEDGTFNLTGNTFRIALNPERIRSTLFTNVRRLENGTLFEGRGWGHGVGMCQWGSKGQAEIGRDYRQILDFYYPNSELQTWSR